MLEEKSTLTLVMCNMKHTAFDFIGETLEPAGNGNIRLRNALALAYADNLQVDRLDDLHIPKGLVDVVSTETIVEVPRDSIAYTVTFRADSPDELPRMYRAFFQVAVN